MAVTVDGAVPDVGVTESQLPPDAVVADALQPSDPPPVFCTWKVWSVGFDPAAAEKANCVALTAKAGVCVTDTAKVMLAGDTPVPPAVTVMT